MAELLTKAEMKEFLEIPALDTSKDTLLDALIGDFKELLEEQCGRESQPFQDAQAGLVERVDGTGNAAVFTAYPIAALTVAVLVGSNPAVPDESLDPTDPEVLTWQVGRRRIMRRDGKAFGAIDAPLAVQITYNAQAYLPKVAKLAVRGVVATVFRQRGSEDATSEREGSYSADLREVIKGNPEWHAAVEVLQELRV